MTLTKLRIIVRRRWPLVVLAAVLCLGAAYLVTLVTDDDEPSELLAEAGPDSYVATGVVGVDRLQLFDQDVDLSFLILEVEEAGLYERVDEERGRFFHTEWL